VCCSCSQEEHLMFSLFCGRLLLLIWVHFSSCSCSFVVLTILNKIPRWLGRMGRKPFNFWLQSTLKITSVEWMAWDDHHPSLKSQAAQRACFLIIGQFLMKGMILSQVSSSSNNQS
jgi:hypothetical protein